MIIVSQDKKELVNFDNILSIKLYHDDEDKECLYEIYTTVNAPGDNYILIGTYTTEERAKEVLNGITRAYEKAGNISFETDDNEQIMRLIHNSSVFEMPEE